MKYPIILLLRAYRYAISPLYGQVCRYHPSCSRYALEAVEDYGALRGTRMAVWRVLRCNPWSDGGYDPVPTRRVTYSDTTEADTPGSSRRSVEDSRVASANTGA